MTGSGSALSQDTDLVSQPPHQSRQQERTQRKKAQSENRKVQYLSAVDTELPGFTQRGSSDSVLSQFWLGQIQIKMLPAVLHSNPSLGTDQKNSSLGIMFCAPLIMMALF